MPYLLHILWNDDRLFTEFISISAGGVSYAGMGSRGGFNMRSGDPEEMYQALYRVFMQPAFEHGPTKAHKALAELEEKAQ